MWKIENIKEENVESGNSSLIERINSYACIYGIYLLINIGQENILHPTHF